MEFINNNFRTQIKDIIKDLFKKLNDEDIDLLLEYTLKLINYIFLCYGFKRETKFYRQFLKNNGQDTKSICLQLIPFVKDYNFTNLNNILYNDNKDFIDKKIDEIYK